MNAVTKMMMDTGDDARVASGRPPLSAVKASDLQPGHFHIQVWVLSEKARRIPWPEWLKIGGCGTPNDSMAFVELGPECHWDEDVTLGDIADACPYTGRTLARFAVEHLGRGDFAEPYESES